MMPEDQLIKEIGNSIADEIIVDPGVAEDIATAIFYKRIKHVVVEEELPEGWDVIDSDDTRAMEGD
jgi:hypothetical protein